MTLSPVVSLENGRLSLVSLVLTVRPHIKTRMPSALGRAAHAALLRALDPVRPELATAWHDNAGLRPFTCSSLLGSRQNGSVVPDVAYTVRYTSLASGLSDVLPSLFPPGSDIELDSVRFRIESATTDPNIHPWAAHISFEDISARWLLGRQAPDPRLTLQLASPTACKSGGKAQVLPLADLVFGSLLDKWNAHAPIALPLETRRFGAEYLAVSRCELRTAAAPFKSAGAVKFGAVGTVTYATLNRDRYWMSVINLLADFAQFAGVGVSTALGMGQAKRVPADSR